jgi:hypothetical protein
MNSIDIDMDLEPRNRLLLVEIKISSAKRTAVDCILSEGGPSGRSKRQSLQHQTDSQNYGPRTTTPVNRTTEPIRNRSTPSDTAAAHNALQMTEAADNANNIEDSPSVKLFKTYNDEKQMWGHHIKMAYWQVPRKIGEAPRITKLTDGNGAVAETVRKLVLDHLWPNYEWQTTLTAMVKKNISDSHTCVATYARTGLNQAPHMSGDSVAACESCIKKRLPCARFCIDDVEGRGTSMIILAGLPEKKSRLASQLGYMRSRKHPNDKGYYVNGL